jgi:hypothetical protein
LAARLGCLLIKLTQSARKLICAAGGTRAAGIAFQKLNHTRSLHTLNKLANGLQIAIASAFKLHVVQAAVFQIKINAARANATRSICMMSHHISSLTNFCAQIVPQTNKAPTHIHVSALKIFANCAHLKTCLFEGVTRHI